MTGALLGTVGIGLVWGWLVVQLIPSSRPSGWAIAGLVALSVVMFVAIFGLLSGQAALIGVATALVAVLAHSAFTESLLRSRQRRKSFDIR
jgi:hypothetical protein